MLATLNGGNVKTGNTFDQEPRDFGFHLSLSRIDPVFSGGFLSLSETQFSRL